MHEKKRVCHQNFISGSTDALRQASRKHHQQNQPLPRAQNPRETPGKSTSNLWGQGCTHWAGRDHFESGCRKFPLLWGLGGREGGGEGEGAQISRKQGLNNGLPRAFLGSLALPSPPPSPHDLAWQEGMTFHPRGLDSNPTSACTQRFLCGGDRGPTSGPNHDMKNGR